MRLSVLMGVEKFWVRVDAEFDEEQVTGPQFQAALMNLGDQAMNQWREVADRKAKQ